VVGQLLLGPITNDHFLHLPKETWFERISTLSLIISITAIGLAPLWLSNIILDSLQPIVSRFF
jgi:NADH-quinone oxidoreductase subunit M